MNKYYHLENVIKNVAVRRLVRTVLYLSTSLPKILLSVTLAPCKQHAADTKVHAFLTASVLKQSRDRHFPNRRRSTAGCRLAVAGNPRTGAAGTSLPGLTPVPSAVTTAAEPSSALEAGRRRSPS